jgi:alpha-L-fucosidase
LWMFVNNEAIYGVRPWIISNEGDIWFTRKKDANTIYAIVKSKERWPFGGWRDLTLKSMRATAQTQVSVLGQNDQVLEYRPEVIPKTTWQQAPDGLHIKAMHAQRLYNNRQWPNPVVLKITNVERALTPPRVATFDPEFNTASKTARLVGALRTLGDSTGVEVGFEYRDITGLDLTERNSSWMATPLVKKEALGLFSYDLKGLTPGHTYDVRAVVKHPLLTLYGIEKPLRVP